MSGLVDKITKAVMGISAIVVFVITFLQVLCRFVLKSPLPWSTDILRLAFTYLVFWCVWMDADDFLSAYSNECLLCKYSKCRSDYAVLYD